MNGTDILMFVGDWLVFLLCSMAYDLHALHHSLGSELGKGGQVLYSLSVHFVLNLHFTEHFCIFENQIAFFSFFLNSFM